VRPRFAGLPREKRCVSLNRISGLRARARAHAEILTRQYREAFAHRPGCLTLDERREPLSGVLDITVTNNAARIMGNDSINAGLVGSRWNLVKAR